MKTLVMLIEYDGTNYAGWQRQPNALSIQEVLENALEKITGFYYPVIGAGRTDAGVHARGQVAHSKLYAHFPDIPEEKLPAAINSHLPEDIRIIKSKYYQGEFHARFDAIAREYSYTILSEESVFRRHFAAFIKYHLNLELLNECAGMFVGKHDFKAFSKYNPETKSYICNIEICRWSKIDEVCLRLAIKADRFVYGMVRALVGAMIDCARGKKTIDDLSEALEGKDRGSASTFAPACGLVLEKIYYPNNLKILE